MSVRPGAVTARTRSGISSDAGLYFDIGSTMVRVLQNGSVVFREPSCVALHIPTGSVVAIGTKAYQLLGKTTAQISVLFPVQHGAVADRKVFELLLKAVLLQIGHTRSFVQLLLGRTGAYSCLSSITPQEQLVLQQSLKTMGLGRVVLQNQMLAAATELQLETAGVGRSYCVIDIGGQVSEIAVLSGTSTVTTVRAKWGGVQCTERIQEVIMQTHQVAVSWHTAEMVKQQLAVVSAPEHLKKHKVSIRGKNLLTQLGQTVVVSNEEIAPVCVSFAETIFKAVQQVFAQTPTEVVTSCLENGIYLIGGGAQLQGLAGYLQDMLHCEVTVAPEPSMIVVRGLPTARSLYGST